MKANNIEGQKVQAKVQEAATNPQEPAVSSNATADSVKDFGPVVKVEVSPAPAKKWMNRNRSILAKRTVGWGLVAGAATILGGSLPFIVICGAISAYSLVRMFIGS